MVKDIEVEVMGSLSAEKFKEIKKLFDEKAVFEKKKERLSFMYFKGKIPKDVAEIKEEMVDLRWRVTNKEPEIVLKYGNFTGSHVRKEIALHPNKEDLNEYVEFLKLIGWHLGVVYATKTQVYTYKEIEFSLAEIKDYGYNFEAEILTDKANSENVKEKIIKELSLLGLKPFEEEGLNKQCNTINNKKELQFDLNEVSFDEIRKRFKEFF